MAYNPKAQYVIHTGKMENVLPTLEGKFHAVLCDPPYGLEFMGKDWDKFTPETSHRNFSRSGNNAPRFGCWTRTADEKGIEKVRIGNIAFQEAVCVWGRALLPILYPGALVMMFGGTRTWHRLAAGMEDAGFQMWDTLMWLHGQGFPKAQDISKLIDKVRGREVYKLASLALRIKNQREALGLTRSEVDRQVFDGSTKLAWVEGARENIYPPTVDEWRKLRNVLGLLDDGTEEMLRIGWDSLRREVTGFLKNPASSIYGTDDLPRNVKLTRPGSIASVPWSGHKTCALKPAWEPVLCFRAPSQGKTYAELAQMFGSGALYVDGGRIEGGDPANLSRLGKKYSDSQSDTFGQVNAAIVGGSPLGRYPANLALDEESAEMLDEQIGNSVSGIQRQPRGTGGIWSGVSNTPCGPQYGDSGGASRFFYCAKSSSAERHSGIANNHPTVKPVDLCTWLATLLLPPSSVDRRRLLVPFSGSGSEMIGALGAGWDEVVGVESDASYCDIARARIKYHNGLQSADGTAVIQKVDDRQPELF